MAKCKVVVVGNGMVGHHFVERLLATGAEAAVVVIGAEPRPAYDRVHLSDYFAGKRPEELALTTREHYAACGVEAHFGDPVVAIDRAAKRVVTAAGRVFAYDKLVLATGSYPFVPPIPGADGDACLTYRTIDDLGRIRAEADRSRVGVVVGGGLLGLECANALRNLGLETHVVEFAPGLMGVQLDPPGSRMLRRKVEALGVVVHTEKATTRIGDGRKRRLVMEFADETSLETDLIVFSAGIRPQDQLARACGLEIGPRGGAVIDHRCLTSDPDIFAIGECASFGGTVFGLVGPGYRMAEVAASQFTADKQHFTGADLSTKLKLLGVEVGSIGDSHGKTPGAICLSYTDERREVYKRINLSPDGKKLLGAVLVGDTSDYSALHQYYLNGLELPAEPESLIFPAASPAPALGPAALPEGATICSCHNVTKGAILAAIDGGALSLADVKGATRASTGCGGCAPLLKSLVDHELAARGVAVARGLCEHFPFTRQELFHIVQVEEIRTFDELLARHGRGRVGCDLCKPAVASILASLWNEHPLAKSHAPLQDTNDAFLANLQKDGTYSVVPRIPGGEITPDKLIAIGRVAKKYNLYTKITGGQRIDLFGATLAQLPHIWRELIDAGFETGHAYGKALRTVKSCVGSTWCRYGVQDSVGMAIRLENRYKGLRAPHKIKAAVSGCTRECAEVQSKDFGVIATDKGWNLYVCGNGGMKPRHADLLATDLDDETLIRTIDRFLMFYVRTADRLQRTSVWLDNLEGGIDYLREVVVEDKLGIGAELEAQMARVIDSYRCEWKATLEDPEKLKRFRQFVNDPDGRDERVVFVTERGQIRPAREEERTALESA
ncbi:MAG: nitrite reductase large subunit [Porticoccaceae bacterium]|nr:MAG: nitrite reductase large subunit [Porticoccaceae bacterium]